MSGYMNEQYGRFTDTSNVNTAVQQGLLKIATVGNQEYYECQVCRRNMAGSVPAEAHLRGSPHFKALRNFSYSAPLAEAVSNLRISEHRVPPSASTNFDLPTRTSNSDCNSDEALIQTAMKRSIVTQSNVNGIVNMTCNLCSVTCTGDVPMAQHLKGEPHMKRQRRSGVQQEYTSEADSKTTQNLEEFKVRHSVSPLSTDFMSDCRGQSISNVGTYGASSDSDDSLQRAIKGGVVSRETSGGVETLTCEVCVKSCTGSIPMKQHLQSGAHIKKLGILGIRVESTRQTNSPSPCSDRNTYQRSSLVENVSFPVATPVPEPPVNRRCETNSDPVAKAILEGVIIDLDGPLMCLVCHLTCTGQFNMSEHLQGDHHRRKLRDQIEQLQIFGGLDSFTKSSTPPSAVRSPPRTSPSSVNVEISRNSSTSRGFLESQSNRMYSNVNSSSAPPDRFERIQPVSCRGHSLILPQNLRDLEVYFPDDPLGDL